MDTRRIFIYGAFAGRVVGAIKGTQERSPEQRAGPGPASSSCRAAPPTLLHEHTRRPEISHNGGAPSRSIHYGSTRREGREVVFFPDATPPSGEELLGEAPDRRKEAAPCRTCSTPDPTDC